MCLNLNDWNWSCEHTFSFKAWGHVPLSESDLSEDMVEPWLSFLILSEPLCSCSSRTLSSLCSQRRRPFICSARSSCSCSFWKVKAQKFNLNPALKKKDRNVVCCLRGGRCCSEHCAFTPTECCVYLYVELGPSQQVEGGVPHRVRWQRNLLFELLQAVPQLSSSAKAQKRHHLTRAGENRALSTMIHHRKSTFIWRYNENMNYLFFSSSLWTDLQLEKETQLVLALQLHSGQ